MNDTNHGASAPTRPRISNETLEYAMRHLVEHPEQHQLEQKIQSLEEANQQLAQDYAYLSLAHTASSVDAIRARAEATKAAAEHARRYDRQVELVMNQAREHAEMRRKLDDERRSAVEECNDWAAAARQIVMQLVGCTEAPLGAKDLREHLASLTARYVAMRNELAEVTEAKLVLQDDLRETHRLLVAAQKDLKLLKPLLDARTGLASLLEECDEGSGFDDEMSVHGLDVIRTFVELSSKVTDEGPVGL